MSNIIYNNNIINKKFLNKETKNKVLDSTFLFLKNNTNSLQFDQIKNLTLIIQKSMNNNKLTQNIITEQLENIKGLFNNDISQAKLLIHYIIIMSRHSSTNTTKINWFFYKDGVNKTKTINYFLENINKENTNKENTKKSTQVLSEGLKIIHNIYINNKDSFDQLQLNSFNINDYTLNVNVDGYSVKLKGDPEKTYSTNQFMSLSYTLLNKDENQIKEIILAENILQHGVDISSDYLSQNSQYKLFRVGDDNITKRGIYAIDIKNMESALMWEKTEKLNDNDILLGEGQNGSVYQITKTKAIKLENLRVNPLDENKTIKQKQIEEKAKIEELKEINEHFLTAKFKLLELKIDNYFILGLHHIKKTSKSNNIGFMMPVFNKLQNELDRKDNLILFIRALKKFNENGYFHPDLSNHPFHYSSQNILLEDNTKPVTFDLDHRLKPGYLTDKLPIKDQWLWFYCNMDENYLNKRDILNEYYRKNKNKAVSDDKNFLKHNFPDFVNF